MDLIGTTQSFCVAIGEIMYSVWFKLPGSDIEHLFVSGVPTFDLADHIGQNLVNEGFVRFAWVEVD